MDVLLKICKKVYKIGLSTRVKRRRGTQEESKTI